MYIRICNYICMYMYSECMYVCMYMHYFGTTGGLHFHGEGLLSMYVYTMYTFCMQLTKAYVAKTSCNQLLLIDCVCCVHTYMLIKIYSPVVLIVSWTNSV